jgi:hypothetical protein
LRQSSDLALCFFERRLAKEIKYVEILFYALLGYCGNEPPWWGPIPKRPEHYPEPPPFWYGLVISVVVGILGGILFDRAFVGTAQIPAASLASFVVTGTGAFAVSRIVTGIASNLRRGFGKANSTSVSS